MSAKGLLFLDLATVLDYASFDAHDRMKNTRESESLKTFKRENPPALTRELFATFFNKALTDFTQCALRRPKLVDGAEHFVTKIADFYRTHRNFHIVASDMTSVMINGHPYRPKFFDPYFEAFRETCTASSFYRYATHENYGLDPAYAIDPVKIDRQLALYSLTSDFPRQAVVVITNDEKRAETAREIGYEAVLIEDNNFSEKLPGILDFLSDPLERKPQLENNTLTQDL
jgi:hypothetical protein